MNVIRKLISRRWWWVTLIVIALMVVLARLGFWQLDRLQQRRDANTVLAAALDAPPFELSASLTRTLEDRKDQQAYATGRFDFAYQVSLKLQTYGELAGVHLIAPFVFDGGDTAILVDRGWVPEEAADPQVWEQFNDVGQTHVEGMIALSQEISRLTERPTPQAAPIDSWYRVDIEAIQNQIPYTLLPVYLIEAPGGEAGLPVRVLPEIEISEGPHLSYAIQWFIFCIGLGVAYIIFVRYREKQKSESSSNHAGE